MTVPTVRFRTDDATELVELLTFVGDLCASDTTLIDQVLEHFLGSGGYRCSDLRSDVVRLADLLSNALGLSSSQMEAAR